MKATRKWPLERLPQIVEELAGPYIVRLGPRQDLREHEPAARDLATKITAALSSGTVSNIEAVLLAAHRLGETRPRRDKWSDPPVLAQARATAVVRAFAALDAPALESALRNLDARDPTAIGDIRPSIVRALREQAAGP